MTVLLSFLLLVSAQDSELRRGPPAMHDAAPLAVDHVAIVEVDEGSGPQPIHRIEFARHGSWMRTKREGALVLSYSDLTSEVSLTYWKDATGTPALSIDRHPSSDTYNRFRRSSTGRTDRALGETCHVWNTTREGEPEGQGVNWLSCETRDGIRLWSRAESSLGTVLSSSRTLRFERRALAPADVMPLRNLLRWSQWMKLAPPSSEDHLQSDYDLALEGENGGTRKRTLRRRGAWFYTESMTAAGDRSIDINNGSVRLHARLEGDGRPVSLSVRGASVEERRLPAPHWTPIDPVATEQVLGETCTWSRNSSAGGGIVVTSGDHRTCVSSDGLPLRIYGHHRVLNANLTATSIRRMSPPLSRVMPPAALFDWRAWGIADLPK